MEKLWTMDEVCEYLGRKKSTLYKNIAQETLPFPVLKIGKHNRFRQSDIEKWVTDGRPVK